MLPNCRLRATTIQQMTPGETRAAPEWALWENLRGDAFLSPNALVGEGSMSITCCCDGFKVDVTDVPTGHRWPRLSRFDGLPVVSITGAHCL
jgi:hypothetical protein